MILVDSNVLLRLADPGSNQKLIARAAVEKLRRGGETLAIVPQNLYEFWAVATRGVGKINGMGMPPARAELWINYLGRQFQFLSETAEFVGEWRRLIALHRVIGGKAHDARLVAAMMVYKIGSLLTFNGDDFRPYAIVALDPANV